MLTCTAQSIQDMSIFHAGPASGEVVFHGVHHVGILVENLERSVEFYSGLLGACLAIEAPDIPFHEHHYLHTCSIAQLLKGRESPTKSSIV